MVTPSQRTSITVETTYFIMRGLIDRGLVFYGPFGTQEEAIEYCGKNFPDDTATVMSMNKETVTHGKDT
jgi:hypothetical protein